MLNVVNLAHAAATDHLENGVGIGEYLSGLERAWLAWRRWLWRRLAGGEAVEQAARCVDQGCSFGLMPQTTFLVMCQSLDEGVQAVLQVGQESGRAMVDGHFSLLAIRLLHAVPRRAAQ
jgi:hypothetical protein